MLAIRFPFKLIFAPLVAGLLSLASTSGDAANKAAEMTNNAIGRPPTNVEVEEPGAYYADRVNAIRTVREGNWQAAKPLLEKLTSQFRDDGDTWYLLGLAYLQHEQWENAIVALENALELGAALHNIPSGSSPSNDLMVKIAEAYAALGDEKKAIAWINKALVARYDERPKLAGAHPVLGENLRFKQIESSLDYQKAAGAYVGPVLSRDAAWQDDLAFLVREIERLHVNMYHATSPESFHAEAAAIHEKIPSLTDRQVVFAFMQLVGSLGNGHNLIVPAFGAKGEFLQLPMQFYWFSDGLFVVKAEKGYRQWVGSKVAFFGDTPAEEALSRTRSLNARDNEMQQRWLGPYYLRMPTVLEELGIVEKNEALTLTLKSEAGLVSTVNVEAETFSFQGFPKLPGLERGKSPRYLSSNNVNYWSEILPESNSAFVQFNDVLNMTSLSLKDFNFQLRDQISREGVDNLILDLRHNSGGDGSITSPLLATLVLFEALNPDGKLFVLMGRNTFSAAHTLLLDIERLTNAILVGEPSGSRPNALSEAGWFQLPHSGITGIVSSQFHQSGSAEDHRIWLAPHVPVSLSSKHYFAGQDPAMDEVVGIIKDSKPEPPIAVSPWSKSP